MNYRLSIVLAASFAIAVMCVGSSDQRSKANAKQSAQSTEVKLEALKFDFGQAVTQFEEAVDMTRSAQAFSC
jgi:hypothetical protein